MTFWMLCKFALGAVTLITCFATAPIGAWFPIATLATCGYLIRDGLPL